MTNKTSFSSNLQNLKSLGRQSWTGEKSSLEKKKLYLTQDFKNRLPKCGKRFWEVYWREKSKMLKKSIDYGIILICTIVSFTIKTWYIVQSGC
jgi:hypothetical protein